MRKALVGLLLTIGLRCASQPVSLSPWQDTTRIRSLMQPDTVYSFLRLAEDTLFLAGALGRTWQKLSTGQKVRVLHIGDSHIQGDVQGREIRRRLYAIWGLGGRGFTFPYALASTTGAYDYVSVGQGQWLYARSVHLQPILPLGTTGIAIGTYDPSASWRLAWPPQGEAVALPPARVGFLVRTLRSGITLEVRYTDSVPISSLALEAGYQFVWLATERPTYFLEGAFRWQGDDSLAYGELHGIFWEDTGRVTYYTMGINGARLADWSRLPLVGQSLALLKPDLVVLDLGTNDLYALEASLPTYRQALEAAIHTIRQAWPGADILITTPMSFYRRMRPLPLLKGASAVARWVAVQKQVALWDAATLLGDIKDWRLAGLANTDMVHLLSPGYALKGQLLARAFLEGYLRYLEGRLAAPQVEGAGVALPDSLFHVKRIEATPSLQTWMGGANSSASGQRSSAMTYAPPKPQYLYHKVRPGETLGGIAQRYRTSVRAIQQANGLQGTQIRAGQTLRIPTRGYGQGPSIVTAGGATNRYHFVRAGESLWSIAQRYGVTVEALCRANKLKTSSTIHPGQRLVIPRR